VTEKSQCPKCGAELSPDAAQGLCPKCLLDAGLESGTASARADAATGPFVTPSQAAAATIPKSARFPTPYLETLARQFPQLDNFEHLGQGGMGVVYKARQRHLNRLVAVKILPPSVGDDPTFTERFTREAQALARLNHPNIVQVHDFGRTDDYFYFVMEYVDGVNLRALIRDGKLKPEEALKIVPQICEALQFAHDEGIVHRDIKPENILIDKKGRVKIADFGLVKLLGHAADDLSLTGTGQLMGTMGYMAPEQLRQAHAVDHRADIYSLGVVFYEMLTGQLPIGRFEPPSKKVQIDVRLDEIVLRSLESEPDRRYQHAVDVKTDLKTVMHGAHTVESASLQPGGVGSRQAVQPEKPGIPAGFWFLLGIGLFAVGSSMISRSPGMSLGVVLACAGIACWICELIRGRISKRPGRPLQFDSSGDEEAQYQSLKRRVLRLGASIAEHPVLWTVALFATLPPFIAIVPIIASELSSRKPESGSLSLLVDSLIICVMIFGPIAFLAWAYLWRVSHRVVHKRRDASDTAAWATADANVRRQVQWAATGLLVAGAIDCAVFAGLVAHLLWSPYRPKLISLQLSDLAVILMILTDLPIGIFTILGAVAMLRLKSWGFPVAACILALIPRFPVTWILGAPMAIWSLIVLNRPAIKAAFRERRITWAILAAFAVLAGCALSATGVSVVALLAPSPSLPMQRRSDADVGP
jgi:predicted Ser/Thr protein kinase